MITVDSTRYGQNSDITSWFKKFLTIPGFRFMLLFRICNKYAVFNPIGLISRIWFKRLQVKYGYQIPHSCKIGNGLFLGHYGNIVINQRAVIGNNCNIAQGVTIGNTSRGKKKGCPTIGDRVWIGANSVIVGKISIGNDVLIAPLALVNFDIPNNAVVAGNPARIISYMGSDGYIKKVVK